MEAIKDVTYYTSALKAPRIQASFARLADTGRAQGWTFEEYLAAVLEAEVTAREASGAEILKRPGFSGDSAHLISTSSWALVTPA